jgi:soluble lytic murein transglycosylase-like protein
MSILFTLLTAITAKASINKEAFLYAIRQVESGDNHAAIGNGGERGAYQFTASTWRMHSKQSHRNAHSETSATIVAFNHLEYLIKKVGGDDVKKLALAWNCGLRGIKKPSKRSKDYAERVMNLYLHNAGDYP